MKKYFSSWLLFFIFLNCSDAQIIVHIAGDDSSAFGGDGGLAIHASLHNPYSICRDAQGNLYIGDGGSGYDNTGRVRKISATTGIITTVAGGIHLPAADSSDNIPATAAQLNIPAGICIDRQGNLLIACGTTKVRKVNLSTGIITTIAGSGCSGYSGNGGAATAACLSAASAVTVDAANNVFICESNNHIVRKIDAVSGVITLVAGSGIAGYSGDNGPATLALLNEPDDIYIDAANNLYISERFGNRVRMVSAATGIITTVAGNGTGGYNGDGLPATDAELYQPFGLAKDREGNLYISDLNFRIRKVDAATGIISTYAGKGTVASTIIDSIGDNGPATAAQLIPYGLVFDTCDNLFFVDRWARVRAITTTFPSTGTICGYKITAVPPAPQQAAGQLSVWPNPATGGSFSLLLQGAAAEPVKVAVTDVAGRRITELTTAANRETPVRLPVGPGLYFITATTEAGRWVSKVVVE